MKNDDMVVGASGPLHLCLSCGAVKHLSRPPYCDDCRCLPIDALVETTKGVGEMENVRVITAVGDPLRAQFAMDTTNGTIVQVRFGDGLVAEVDAAWLRAQAEGRVAVQA